MVKYTREQRLRAVRLYERYDRSTASVINELGCPSRQMLVRWHRAWVEAGRDDGGSLGDGRGERYTPGQKRAAVDHYLRHGRCAARTIRALGYPCKALLARWVDELEPGQRRIRRAPVDARTRRKAVVEYASGSRTSRQVGEELGAVPMSCETGSTRCLRATTRSVRWATTRTRAERRSPARTGTAMTVADPLRACGGNATGYVRS